MADPTLRDFPDRYERIIARGQVASWGGLNLEHLAGCLQALYAEVQAAHRRVSANGGLVVADTTALQAILKADLTTALADDDVTVVLAYKVDDDRLYRWDPADTTTADADHIASGEGGDGRWVALFASPGGVEAATVTQVTSTSTMVQLDVATLGEHALIWTNSNREMYYYDSDSTASASAPDVYVPNAGSGRFLRISPKTAILNDATIFKTNWSNQITGLTEEVSPGSGDWLLLERSSDGSKRKVQVGNVGGGGGGGGGSMTVIGDYSTWAYPQTNRNMSSGSWVTLDDGNITGELDIDPSSWTVGTWVRITWVVYIQNFTNETLHFRLYEPNDLNALIDTESDEYNSNTAAPQTGAYKFELDMLVEDDATPSLMQLTSALTAPGLDGVYAYRESDTFDFDGTKTFQVEVKSTGSSAQVRLVHFGYEVLA